MLTFAPLQLPEHPTGAARGGGAVGFAAEARQTAVAGVAVVAGDAVAAAVLIAAVAEPVLTLDDSAESRGLWQVLQNQLQLASAWMHAA